MLLSLHANETNGKNGHITNVRGNPHYQRFGTSFLHPTQVGEMSARGLGASLSLTRLQSTREMT